MKKILFISSFDPISNKFIKDIEEFNSDNVKFIFYFLYSKYASLDDRKNMLKLALKGHNINYEINESLSTNLVQTIDLVKILNSGAFDSNDEVYLLIRDEKTYLVPENKIREVKAKLTYKDSVTNPSTQIRVLKNLDTPKAVIDYIVEHHLYFMTIVESYIKGHRLIHCVSVANTAYDIAVANNFPDADQYYIAGLLHDIGKQADGSNAQEIMEKYFREYIDMPDWSWHQFVGTIFTKQFFPYVNDECLKAIFTHCTGDSNMSKMQKVIYASDKIEPTRGYDSSELIKACKENYDSGFKQVLQKNMDFIIEKSGTASNNLFTSRCIKAYLQGEYK